MDENPTRLLSGHPAKKYRTISFIRLRGMFLLICLILSYLGTVASASAMSVSSSQGAASLSIPQGSTPAGWRTVNYGSVSIAVPASWPVNDLKVHPERCVLFNTHAVYLGHQSPDALCPARVIGKSEALQLEPLTMAAPTTLRRATATTTVAGMPARVDPSDTVSHTFTVVLSQAKVIIYLSYGHTSKLARQILGTLHVSATSTSSGSSLSITPSHTALQVRPKLASASQSSGPSTGQGFDTCAAPSTGTMSAWLNSPYRAVGIYIGGANRACGDGNLSSSWVNTVTGSGWSLMPIYVGLQAPCNTQFATIDPNQAASQGTQAADDAVSRAQGFGLGNGTLLINDMEGYNNSDSACSQAVMTFLNAWTQEVHARAYLSGVYSSLSSGITDLINNIGRIQEPDTIWFARWDGVATTSDPSIPNNDWANHKRIKQYQGGHNETWGGATINIDSDYLDAVLHGSRHIAGMSSFGSNTYQLHRDGSIWLYKGPPLTGWQELDNNPNAVAIAADGNGKLYQLRSDGSIWLYQGTPMTGWLKVDNNPAAVAIAADGQGHLYQLHNDGTVWLYQGTPLTGWQELDKWPGNIALATDGLGGLYLLHSDGSIWIYRGTPYTWQEVDNNPAATAIAADGKGHLYQLHNDGTVWLYQGTPMTGWQELDKWSGNIAFAVDNVGNLYLLHTDGSIWIYQGTPYSWQELDNNPATSEIAANATGQLYQLHNDGSIWLYQGPPLTGWLKLDNNPATIALSGAY